MTPTLRRLTFRYPLAGLVLASATEVLDGPRQDG
jgi:hypothetical protein